MTVYARAVGLWRPTRIGSPLPLPRGRKASPPVGFTGSGGAVPSEADYEDWKNRNPDGNVGLRLAPNVVGIDVDDYEKGGIRKRGGQVLAMIEENHGLLPDTWVSTSRDDGVSGIRLFRVDPSLAEEFPGVAGPDIEIIRYGHRYMVVSPSTHPGTGEEYRLTAPDGTTVICCDSDSEFPIVDDLPWLPDDWTRHLLSSCRCGEGRFESDEPFAASPPRFTAVSDAAHTLERALETGTSRHDTATSVTMYLVRQEATDELERLRTLFIEAVAGARHGAEREAAHEWDSMVASATKKVTTTPTTVREQSPLILLPGSAALDTPSIPESVWGDDEMSLWAVGEPALLYAATGVGKTTLAHNLAIASIGIGPPNVLGYAVNRFSGNVLYVAADRPRQAMRSLRRLVGGNDRESLDAQLLWETKRQVRITPDHPERLLQVAQEAGCEGGAVILDSIKDLISKISTDEAGGAYNDAIQLCIVNDIQVLSLHHPRKATADGRGNLSLDDVFGSTWVTAGQGSVIALNGIAGSGVVTLDHLKQPADKIATMDISIDYESGLMVPIGVRDIRAHLENVDGTQTTRQVVEYVTGKKNYTDAELRRIERTLHRLAERGEISHPSGSGRLNLWGAAESTALSFDPETLSDNSSDSLSDSSSDNIRHGEGVPL